jgi:ferredoxin--NADP+ reductase
MKKWIKGQIAGKRQWSETLFSLQLEAPLPDFSAGQFIKVAMDIEGERVGRPYSLVNAPEQRPLEIYFNEIPEGPLTPRLSRLTRGDPVWISEKASGVFTLERIPACRDLWLFATGTALGVYLSILNTDAPWQRFDNIVLIHGCRTADELTYGETIEGFVDRYPEQFRFMPVLSRQASDDIARGRITDLFEKGTLEEQVGLRIDASTSHVMLCGNSGMIGDMKALLEQRGMKRNGARTPGHYTTEQYH